MNIEKEFQLALKYYKTGHFEQAALVCESILNKKPQEIPVLHFIGVIYYQLQNYDAATKQLKKVLALDPSSFEGFYNLGNAFHKKGLLNEAADCYRNVIQRGGRVCLDSQKQFLSDKLFCLMPLPASAVV